MPEVPHVVVVGCGVAGLMAAAVFAVHANVTIVDKDFGTEFMFDTYVLGRRGTPQDVHVHSLLEGGRLAIERRLPGFTERLIKNGAREVDRSNDVAWFHAGSWKKRYVDGGKYYLCTRPVIERTMRECIRDQFGVRVRFMFDKRVTDLIYDSNRVTGVKFDDLGVLHGCDLVVDATGRFGDTLKLLDRIGFKESPRTQIVEVNLKYSTLMFELPLWVEFGAEVTVVSPSTDRPVGVVCMRLNPIVVPGSRPDRAYAICTLFSYHASTWPSSHDQFMAELRMLPSGLFLMLSCGVSMSKNPAFFNFPRMERRYWEEMTCLPDGFISVGDAVCSFDPVFGQGMTHAVMGVDRLEPVIGRLLRGESGAARHVLARAGYASFVLNAVGDCGYSGTKGFRPFCATLVRGLLHMVFRAQGHSIEVCRVVWRVAHLQSSVFTLFDPRFVVRVFWYGFKSG